MAERDARGHVPGTLKAREAERRAAGQSIADRDLEHRFQFHPAGDESTRETHEAIRQAGLEFARKIVALTPPGREASTAVTKAEEAMFWANAGVARGDGPHT